MLRLLYITLLASLLGACVSAPTRSDSGAFKLTQHGEIPTSSTQLFTDCLMDGFDASSIMLANVAVRQQRRTERYRVEVLTQSSVLLSADVFDNGRVELHESSAAALVNLSKEHKAFSDCLSRFRGAS
ncbi:hypothetical protein C8R31_106153 [Nitrosospira sp. Nsp2]|nr:hypothetical protein C8R31_106153 [Nitrosospira sp. Nsp2]